MTIFETLTHQDVFTPGPVRMADDILRLGAMQCPYFRNEAFSQLVLQCERWLLNIANAPEGSRVVFLTSAGTAAMEAVVMNLLSRDKTTAVVNGGTFGQRFVDICAVHQIPVRELLVDRDPLSDGCALSGLDKIDALLINAHETSVGHLYDLQATARFCRDHKCLHVVDGISAFITDSIDMQAHSIDALIVSSHKGLGLPPGLAMILLSPTALHRVHSSGSYYLDFASHLRDGTRGQTPFTPAVSIFMQLHERLRQIVESGIESEWARAQAVAAYFRNAVARLPVVPYSAHMPNAMTALELTNGISAEYVVRDIETRHRVVVAPNGGDLHDRVFRVSHMGATDFSDMDRVVSALTDVLGVRK